MRPLLKHYGLATILSEEIDPLWISKRPRIKSVSCEVKAPDRDTPQNFRQDIRGVYRLLK